MGKEIAKTDSNKEIAVPEHLRGFWGGENISNSDILIPRILLMQGLSTAVADGLAAQGDFLRSTTKKHLAKKGEALEFVPLMTFKTWIISEIVANKAEWRGEAPMSAANEGDDLEFTAKNKDGKDAPFRRDRAINIYVLLKQDLERYEKARANYDKNGIMPTGEDALLPCLLSFRRTSYRAGKQMMTFFKSCEQFKVPPAGGTYKLSALLEKGVKGNYHTFQVEQAGRTPVEYMQFAKDWYDVLRAGKVKVDVDVQVEDVSTAAAAAPVDGHEENF